MIDLFLALVAALATFFAGLAVTSQFLARRTPVPVRVSDRPPAASGTLAPLDCR